MRNFFGRREEVEEETIEIEELEIIDLDETAGWSKLDVLDELEKQQAENLMEEIGDELAIIDVLENDVKIEEVIKLKEKEAKEMARKEPVPTAVKLKEPEAEEPELEEPELEELELEELGEEDLEEEVEYLSMEEEEEEEDEEEYEEVSPFVFFENIAAWFNRWTTMDKIVAVSGILVFAVAVLTIGVYSGKRGMDKQIEAFAPIGQQLESIGVVGSDKLLAVADAKKAMLEAAKLEAEISREYEEEEINSEVKVIMKMTSVQKDLKIKFVNKKTGKLVGNIPFEVEITDAEKKTYHKVDEDKDGIIYLADIVPGSYKVSMVELADVEGYSFSTAAETIKVRENIAYEKVDVSDEIKDQSQVDVSKEDTAQKTETEAALTDTVEWVESGKKENGTTETYTKVSKDTITPPGTSASLKLDPTVLNYLPKVPIMGQNLMPLTMEEDPGTLPVQPAEMGITLDKTTLELEVGGSGKVTATVTGPEEADKSVTWSSSDPSVAEVGTDGTVTAKASGNATITATISGSDPAIFTSCTVSVKVPPAPVVETTITLNKAQLSLEAGKKEGLTATVSPEGKAVEWKSSNQAVATVENGTVTAVSEGTAEITASVTTETNETKSAKCIVTVSKAVVKTITLDKTTANMKISDTIKITATVSPAGEKVIFQTSDETKAVVDGNGNVTAKAEGGVEIKAVMESTPSVTAVCKITIVKGYDPKVDTATALKDNSGKQLYVLVNGKYVEAKIADYYKYDAFYIKEVVSQYIYTGWQNLDGKTYFFDKNGNKVTGEQVIQGAKYQFNSDGSLNTGSGVLGIDVSTWNGNIDWNKVKNSGVSYVIIRTGFRGSTQGALVEDNKFRQNIKGATNAGLKVGVYFFSQAVNEVEAVEEASMVLSQVKGYKLSYPVFIDVEPSGGRADKLTSDARTKVINAFCQTIQNGGYRAGIYANKTWLNQKMNISALSGYKIWLAQYNSTVTYGGRYDMWQYSSKGSVSGISGNVDMNLSYLSY